jgi:hypothetical protein
MLKKPIKNSYFWYEKNHKSIDEILNYVDSHKPTGSWIDSYIILDNYDGFLVFFELRIIVTSTKGNDNFKNFKFSTQKAALTEFVKQSDSDTMTSLMFNIYFKTFELDNYELVEVTFSSSSTQLTKTLIRRYFDYLNDN